jgi:hypothetical protein
MQTSTVSRRQLLDILLSISEVSSEARKTAEPHLEFEPTTEVRVVWRDVQDNSRVPGLIVVEKSKQRDFFAWVTTFVPTLRPFSAFFRVIDPDAATRILNSDRRPLHPRLASGLIGLIIADATTLSKSTRQGVRLTARDCLGSASFCLARSLVTGLQCQAKEIIDDWGSAKDLVENRTPLPVPEMRYLWDIVNSLADRKTQVDLTAEQETILVCCSDILEDGEISPNNWIQLASKLRELETLPTLLDGTRENRVIMLERLLTAVLRSSEPFRNSKPFICGYLTSLVAPGTLDHMGLLAQVSQTVPTAPLWYGLCAGLKGGDATYLYSGGVGRRVMRELTRHSNWTDVPTCDIALNELAVLMANSRNVPDWLQLSGPYVDIEVAPGVNCVLRYSDTDRDSINGPRAIPPAELRKVSDRLKDITLRIEDVQRELFRMGGGQISNQELKARGRK